MKIKLYIITYNRPKALEETLDRIILTDQAEVEITVVNNHTNFYVRRDRGCYYRGGVYGPLRILHNQTRPNWSCGNLSENYNQCLLDGFRSLTSPDCDIVTHIQDDCMLHEDWMKNLLKMHEKYTFVVGKYGDNIVSYKPEAVKKIGMWDENFCGIQHKEADYLIRALICNKEKSCINDILHKRMLNNEDALELDIVGDRNFKVVGGKLKRLPDDGQHEKIKLAAVKPNKLLRAYFASKWNGTRQPEFNVNNADGWFTDWTEDFVKSPPRLPANFGTFIKYPWFEKDLDDNILCRYLISVKREWFG